MTNEKRAGNNTGKRKEEMGSSNSNGEVRLVSGGELHRVAGGNHPVLKYWTIVVGEYRGGASTNK